MLGVRYERLDEMLSKMLGERLNQMLVRCWSRGWVRCKDYIGQDSHRQPPCLVAFEQSLTRQTGSYSIVVRISFKFAQDFMK